MFEGRIRWILAAFAGLWFVFLGRVLLLQTTGAGAARQAVEERRTATALLPPRRGAIRDAGGRLLARDDLGFELVADVRGLGAAAWECSSCGRTWVTHERDPGPGPDDAEPLPPEPPISCRCADPGARFEPVAGDAVESLAALAGEEPGTLRARIADIRRQGWRVARAQARARGDRWRRLTLADWVTRRRPVLRDVSRDMAMAVTLEPERFRGFAVEARSTRRVDPDLDPVTRLVLGSTGPATAEDERRLAAEGLTLPEMRALAVGRSGVERAFDGRLRGTFGRESAYRDLHGGLLERSTLDPVEDGEDLRLTCHADWNGAAERILGDRRGGLVAMDPRDGAILALAGTKGIEEDGMMPAAAGWVPGSVLKLLTAAVGMEGDLAAEAGEVECRGRASLPIRCTHVHGRIGMRDAISGSCNVYFSRLGILIGVRPLEDWARILHIDRPARLGLPGEGGGTDWTQAVWKDPWVRTDLANLGIGQGPVKVSPVQVGALYAAVANGGRPVTPHLVQGGGGPVEAQALSPGTVAVLRAGLEDTVRSGTATGAGLHEFRAAGKTGTAQAPPGPGGEKRLNAWFAGYAPAEDPRIVVVVVLLDQDLSGGEAAAPVVAEFLRFWRDSGGGR